MQQETAVFAFQRTNSGLAELGADVDRSTTSHSEPFQLEKALWVSFECVDQCRMTVARREAPDGRGCLRITPVTMGASRWFTLELSLDITDLQDCSSIVPVVVAAAGQSASVFAAIRIFDSNHGCADTGSVQLEFRKDRQSHSFPIDLTEVDEETRRNATEARLIFFVEARDVNIDLYSLQIYGIRAVEEKHANQNSEAACRSVLAGAAASGLVRQLRPEGLTSSDRLSGETKFGDECFLNYDSANGQSVSLETSNGWAIFDFSGARESRWRTLEFRFSLIKPAARRALSPFSKSVEVIKFPKDPAVAIRLQAYAPDVDRVCHLPMKLRLYDEDGHPSFDTGNILALNIGREPLTEALVEPLSAHLPVRGRISAIGALFYVPPQRGRLAIREFVVGFGSEHVG